MEYLSCPECGKTVFDDKEVCPYCGYSEFGAYKRQKEQELNDLRDELLAKQPVSGEAAGHAYVDLGLPSGTLWATCNIGAKAPLDYGEHFAWGETKARKEITYDWKNYKHCNGNGETLTKYCYIKKYGNKGFTDNLTELLDEDDAATVIWGKEWRMPTYDEANELFSYCNHKIVKINEMNLMHFIGPNSNYILMPAAGIYGPLMNEEGSLGRYWLRSLSAGVSYSNYAWAINSHNEDCFMCDETRDYGLTIRPVCVNKKTSSKGGGSTPALKPIGPLTE